MRRRVATLLLGGSTACATHWQPVALPPAAALEPRAILEIRLDSTWIRLHGVTFGRDALAGIPTSRRLTCDSCRVRYAFADIAAARRPDPGQAAPVWRVVVPVVLGLGVVGYIINVTSASNDH